MNDKELARTAFGNPGLFDFITRPIVSALTGIPQEKVAQIQRVLPPTFGIASSGETVLRFAAKTITPQLQPLIDAADNASSMYDVDEDDDPGNTDQEDFE